MKINHFLLHILWISLLSSQITQQTETNQTKTGQPRAIKFQRPSFHGAFSFPMQFGSENVTFPVLITMDSHGLCVSNASYSALTGHSFSCLESKNCQIEGESVFGWVESEFRAFVYGTRVRDKVSFGGFTIPDFSVFILNEIHFRPSLYIKDQMRLGLGNYSNVPGQLKAKGVIEELIFSISLHNDTDGELVLGGYPSQKNRSDFEFADLAQDDFGRLAIQTKDVLYEPSVYHPQVTMRNAVIDLEYPSISLPFQQYYDYIDRKIDSKGLRLQPPFVPNGRSGEVAVSCKALTVMEDLAIELESLTLYIPASAYIRYGKGEIDRRESKEDYCFLAVDRSLSDQEYILGQPFFKAYNVVLDHEKKIVGFSAKYPSNHSSRFWVLTGVVLVMIALGVSAHFFMKKRRGGYQSFSAIEEPSSADEVGDNSLVDDSQLEREV